MLTAMFLAQACAALPADGVVVTEGRAGFDASIAATPAGVLAVWSEMRPMPNAYPPTAVHAVGRRLAPSTLVPVSPAQVLSVGVPEDSEAIASNSAPVAVAFSDGTLEGGACRSAAYYSDGGADIDCFALSLGAVAPFSSGRTRTTASIWRRNGDVTGSPIELGRAAAASVGSSIVWAVPTCGRIDAIVQPSGNVVPVSHNIGGSRLTAFRNGCARGASEIDVPAVSAAGSDQAVVVWRERGRIMARLVGVDAQPRGAIVPLSSGGESGAPAVTWTNGSAQIVFATRANRRAPWQLQLVSWTPGNAAPPAPTMLATGTEPAMAPSIVPSATAGCTVLSWTEGHGHGTVVRAGRVCNGALVTESVSQLSAAGTEGGDSELATDGTHVYVVWQQIGAAPRRTTELRVARLTCP